MAIPSYFKVPPFKSIFLSICSGVKTFLKPFFALQMILSNATPPAKLLLNTAFAIASALFSLDKAYTIALN